MEKTQQKYKEYPMAVRKFMDPSLCLFYDDKVAKDEESVLIIKEAISPNASTSKSEFSC